MLDFLILIVIMLKIVVLHIVGNIIEDTTLLPSY
jgi:hypothetical protein